MKLTDPELSQEIPLILWNPKIHYNIHKPSPSVLILSQINPGYSTPSDILIFLILTSHLRLGLQVVTFPQFWPTKPCMLISYPVRATYPAHLILLYLII